KFDLTLVLFESEQGLSCAFEYRTELFEAPTIARLADHFQSLLEGIIADPGRSTALLPLLSKGERTQLLWEWNATVQPYPQQPVHELIAAQVARTPESVALMMGEQHLTYGALEARASQLAHFLRERGVGVEARVCLYLARSVELVIAVLGVLKAGGAYVPLDAASPPARLAFVVQDV